MRGLELPLISSPPACPVELASAMLQRTARGTGSWGKGCPTIAMDVSTLTLACAYVMRARP